MRRHGFIAGRIDRPKTFAGDVELKGAPVKLDRRENVELKALRLTPDERDVRLRGLDRERRHQGAHVEAAAIRRRASTGDLGPIDHRVAIAVRRQRIRTVLDFATISQPVVVSVGRERIGAERRDLERVARPVAIGIFLAVERPVAITVVRNRAQTELLLELVRHAVAIGVSTDKERLEREDVGGLEGCSRVATRHRQRHGGAVGGEESRERWRGQRPGCPVEYDFTNLVEGRTPEKDGTAIHRGRDCKFDLPGLALEQIGLLEWEERNFGAACLDSLGQDRFFGRHRHQVGARRVELEANIERDPAHKNKLASNAFERERAVDGGCATKECQGLPRPALNDRFRKLDFEGWVSDVCRNRKRGTRDGGRTHLEGQRQRRRVVDPRNRLKVDVQDIDESHDHGLAHVVFDLEGHLPGGVEDHRRGGVSGQYGAAGERHIGLPWMSRHQRIRRGHLVVEAIGDRGADHDAVADLDDTVTSGRHIEQLGDLQRHLARRVGDDSNRERIRLCVVYPDGIRTARDLNGIVPCDLRNGKAKRSDPVLESDRALLNLAIAAHVGHEGYVNEIGEGKGEASVRETNAERGVDGHRDDVVLRV